MANVNDVYGGQWVKASDLRGQDVTVTIEAEDVQEFKDEESGKKKKQIALSFVGMAKRLGVNATNAAIISGLYGEESSGWVGNNITLYPTKTTFKGGLVDCIRVRESRPAEKPLPLPEPKPEPEPEQETSGPVTF